MIISLLQTRAIKTRIAAARPRLYRLAYAWCHDPYLADDLAQDAMTKGLRAAHQLKDDTVLDAWLFSILNNCLRDHFRRLHPQTDIEAIMDLPADGLNPEQQHAESELVSRVRRAVAELPLGQRQVVTLIELEELSYSAAAQALGIPIGTVMSRLSRARLALRDLLLETAVPASLHMVSARKNEQ